VLDSRLKFCYNNLYLIEKGKAQRERKMNKNEFVPVLKDFGFNLKTKAFNSLLSNPKSKFYDYKNVLMMALPEAESEVYAMILFNSHLNGSYVNWGDATYNGSYITGMSRAEKILNPNLSQAQIEHLISGLKDIVQVKTVRRWAGAFKAVMNKKSEIKIAESQALFLAKITEECNSESQAVSVVSEIKDLTLKQIEKMLGFKVRLIA